MKKNTIQTCTSLLIVTLVLLIVSEIVAVRAHGTNGFRKSTHSVALVRRG